MEMVCRVWIAVEFAVGQRGMISAMFVLEMESLAWTALAFHSAPMFMTVVMCAPATANLAWTAAAYLSERQHMMFAAFAVVMAVAAVLSNARTPLQVILTSLSVCTL